MGGFRRPESILLVVHTPALDVLLLRRTAPFDFWQSITGSLQDGETADHAVRRELAEETGIAPADALTDTGRSRTFTIDPRWRHRYAPGVTENLEYEWRLCLPARQDIAINPEEHDEWQWLPVAEAIEAVWSWTNKAALQALFEEHR